MNTPAFQIEELQQALIVSPLRRVSDYFETEVNDAVNLVLKRISETNPAHVILDFSAVKMFGSGMLDILLKIRKALNNNKDRLVVCGLSDASQEVLRISNFDSFCTIYPTKEEALESTE